MTRPVTLPKPTPPRTVGIVLHPRRDSADAVGAILDWAADRGVQVLGVDEEISRLRCAALPVPAAELGARSDLVVSLGGDGTMLRAMRLADGGPAPVLGVNLGKLGFLPEVDVPDLPAALCAIDQQRYTAEPRLAVDAELCGRTVSAFNDVAVVRVPGHGGSAAVCLRVDDRPFVSYAADAVVVATPTGSTAYSFSAGGPIVSPSVEALLVTPAAPHSAFNRGLVLSVRDDLALEVLPASGRLAVEVDGHVCGYVEPGASISLRSRPAAAHVVRLGRTTFYERAQRKLRLMGSAEVEAAPPSAPVSKPVEPPGRSVIPGGVEALGARDHHV
ncbi:NAD(+)/NADH kinase [Frankia sp. AgB1.9]|uniref:NAD(+)/NADH kinase n=1 Tax=unclassified Frankia TaxID=2632575 RepID=UPI0019345F75|nr:MULTISPECIES: NAD(+)/NADH kinase [unclassified Frankia]MBL7494362.1 NAD(+)/NADH kinase [Frankia sp. AgW1.1]MBL7551390.1 NAD(+)/NADH kinase [Frankia sp. AgB1.9]MBL7620725.1 NAD(+)/NADH kinase [Frankia sp. AgB1.8]